MHSDRIPESTKQWLQNEDFILWCLAPTQESEEWWVNYQKEHPEDQASLQEARKIMLSARLNPVQRLPEESERLWARIETSMERRDKRHRFILFTRYAAACVLILGIVSFWLIHSFQTSGTADDLLVNVKADTLYQKVMLIRDDAEAIQIENNAVITYDSNITIQSDGKETEIIKEGAAQPGKQNTLIVPYGSHSSIVLADGSKVWIHSGSKLRFPSSFGPGERGIKVEGEIYIEVAKDTSRPFYVETPQLTVNVLGTKFNVSAYADDALQSVVLVEGKVNVKANSNEDFVLLPNQRFKLSDGISGIDEVNAYDYISWKDGVLQFRGETMKDIIQRLSRYYNVSITCTPEVAQKCTMGKLILFDDIEQVMKTFSLLYDVQCTIEAGSIKIE